MLLYLAAAGIGTLGIVDDDKVDLSNLQRQVLFDTENIGDRKTEGAKQAIKAINPDIAVNSITTRITKRNAFEIMSQYDIIADGSDNFATRFLINDASYFLKKILVSGAILRFDGQISTFKPNIKNENGDFSPCYRCIFREPPPPGQVPSCAEAGVLGSLCGLVGSFQATEVIKELLKIGNGLSGSLVILDGLNAEFRKIKVTRDPCCPLCGDNPTITDLSSHE